MTPFRHLCACILIVAASTVGATWQEFTGRSKHSALDRVSHELEQKHGLKLVGFSERVDADGHWDQLGISLEGYGCHEVEDARALLADCARIAQTHIDAEASLPVRSLTVTIYFNDIGGDPTLEPYISIAEADQSGYEFCWQTTVDQIGYSRQVKEPR
jgi:hypothetical protein